MCLGPIIILMDSFIRNPTTSTEFTLWKQVSLLIPVPDWWTSSCFAYLWHHILFDWWKALLPANLWHHMTYQIRAEMTIWIIERSKYFIILMPNKNSLMTMHSGLQSLRHILYHIKRSCGRSFPILFISDSKSISVTVLSVIQDRPQ